MMRRYLVRSGLRQERWERGRSGILLRPGQSISGEPKFSGIDSWINSAPISIERCKGWWSW